MATTKFVSCLFAVVFPLLLVLLLMNSDSTTAISSSYLVRHLPGFDGPLPFELETGYVNVDESEDVHLFYYFVKSENNPRDDPVIFWFTGGPSCSGLYSLFFEIGPITIKKEIYNGSLPTLELRPYSWSKVSNIIFLDSPVDTGFSYSSTLQGSSSSDTLAAKQAHVFIRKWLVDHPELISNPLYIGGSSYSGIVVPAIVQEISSGNEVGSKPLLNLKGYFLGNPITNRTLEENSVIPFAYGMGIIPIEIFKKTKRNCKGVYDDIDDKNIRCAKDLHDISQCTSRLSQYHILEKKCVQDTPPRIETFRSRSSLEIADNTSLSLPFVPEYDCMSYGYFLSYYWANDNEVQKALNVRKGTIQEWIRCKYDRIVYLKDIESSVEYHLNLSKKPYRSLIYSGDHDMVVPFLSTQEWIKSLSHSIRDYWRPWIVGEQIGGYTRTYTSNMTFATVKGGGHIATEYKPKESFFMMKKWLSMDPL